MSDQCIDIDFSSLILSLLRISRGRGLLLLYILGKYGYSPQHIRLVLTSSRNRRRFFRLLSELGLIRYIDAGEKTKIAVLTSCGARAFKEALELLEPDPVEGIRRYIEVKGSRLDPVFKSSIAFISSKLQLFDMIAMGAVRVGNEED